MKDNKAEYILFGDRLGSIDVQRDLHVLTPVIESKHAGEASS